MSALRPHERVIVFLLCCLLLLGASLFAQEPQPQVSGLVGASMSAASDTDATVREVGRIDAVLPVPVGGLRFDGSLEVTALPDAAFSFSDLRTWSRGLRITLQFSKRIARSDAVVLSVAGGWGAATLIPGEENPRRHYLREYWLGLRFDVGAANLVLGYGRDEIVSPVWGPGQWKLRATFPTPGNDLIWVLLDGGLGVGTEESNRRARDYAILAVAVDPVAALGKVF